MIDVGRMEEDLEGNYRGLTRYCVSIAVEALSKTGVIPPDSRSTPRYELGITRVEVYSTTTTAGCWFSTLTRSL
jgi:hypothetical protein